MLSQWRGIKGQLYQICERDGVCVGERGKLVKEKTALSRNTVMIILNRAEFTLND